ncbi:MAG: thiamine pyrophosphate-binding protein, partial [Paramuribaculum intestinale]
GMHGNVGPNGSTTRAAVIVAVGMRFDDRVTGDVERYATGARIVHIDIDASEFNKNIPAAATVHGDARHALEGLIPMITSKTHDEWLASFDRCDRVEYDMVERAALGVGAPAQGAMCMGEVARKVSEVAGPDAVLVTDVGQNQLLSARYFNYCKPRSIITSGGLGTMGFGLPAAIGAKMAAPERPVCIFCGDGGFQMTIQELGTIMQYGTAVKIIVLNNDYLGNVRQWQAMFYDNRFSQTPMVNPDFVAIVRAYGIKAENVERREDLEPAIRRMMEHPGAYMLNVRVDERDMVFPMTPGGEAVDYILLDEDTVFSDEE